MKKKFLITILIAIFFSDIILVAQESGDIKIGIVYSEKTKQLIFALDNNFNPIQDWELFFLNRKITYTVISDGKLDDNDFDFLDVLILPSVEVLSEDAAENLYRFLNDGKGLLIFGKFDVYDSEGNKKYIHPFQEIAGFGFSDLNTEDKIAEQIKLSSSVININLSGEDEFLVLNRFNPLVANYLDKNCKVIGNYSFPDDKSETEKNPAVIMLEKNNGRILWFGMQLSQILGDKEEDAVVEKLIFNSINWLSQYPVLAITKWPKNYTVPVIISSVLNNPKSISENLFNQILPRENKINFFINIKDIASIENIPGYLFSAGDINLFLNPYFSDDQINDSLFQRQYDILKANGQQKCFGIKMSDYHFDQIKDRTINFPFDFILSGNNSFYFHKDVVTDKKHFEERRIPSVTFSIEGNEYNQNLTDFEKIYESARDNEDVVFLNSTNQVFKVNSNENILFSEIEKYLKDQDVQSTTYSVLFDWISKRDNITLKTERTGEENNYKISIENRNKSDFENLSLQLFPPALKINPQISSDEVQLEYNAESKLYIITVPYIKAETKAVFNLTFDEGK